MSLLRKHLALTIKEARELHNVGFVVKFVSMGCLDKDFYDVYVVA